MNKDEMAEKLRKLADIKEISAGMLSGIQTLSFLPELIQEKMLEGGYVSEDMGEMSKADAQFLELMAGLVETGEKATPEQLERLRNFAEEKERWADSAQMELDDYNNYHEEEDDEPNDDEDDIEEYREEAKFFLSVVEVLQ